MITKKPAYFTSSGQACEGLEEAQKAALASLLKDDIIEVTATEREVSTVSVRITEAIMRNADKIIDILTTTPTSRTKARKVNGGKKSKKADPAKKAADDAHFARLEAMAKGNAALQDAKQ
jgi:hypothetical protein